MKNTLVLSAFLVAAVVAHADTMYWWKNAATTDFFDLANWRVESETGATPVTALATNVADTAIVQKCAASVVLPAATEATLGNLTVGTNANNSDTSLAVTLGKEAKLTGSGKLMMPAGTTATKAMTVNAPEGGTFAFAGGVEFNRHGRLTFTGTGITVTNTPLFNIKYQDNHISFPAGTTIDTTALQPGAGEFSFTVTGPNSTLRNFKYDWGSTSQTIVHNDSFVAFTNGVTLTDANFEYFRGLRSRLVLEDVEANFVKNISIKDDLNRLLVKDSRLTLPTLALLGRTNTAAIVNSEITATKFELGGNANHVKPLLVLTNTTAVGMTTLGVSALNGRLELVDSVVEAQALNMAASALTTGNVVMVSGPAARLTIHKSDTSATLAMASENAASGSDNAFIVTNRATMVVDKIRVGGSYGVSGQTFGIYDGASVTSTGIFRFCNNATATRGGERSRLIIDKASLICCSEIQLGGSNNLVRVTNGGLWQSLNGQAAPGTIVGGAYDYLVDDGAIVMTNLLLLSSNETLPTQLTIRGARGRVQCRNIQCAAGTLTLGIPKTGRTIDAPMLRLTQHDLNSKQDLYPEAINLNLELDIPDGISRRTAGESIDLIDISHTKGVLGEHWYGLTNSISAASLKGCTLQFVPGSGGVADACLRLYPPKAGGLVVILR